MIRRRSAPLLVAFTLLLLTAPARAQDAADEPADACARSSTGVAGVLDELIGSLTGGQEEGEDVAEPMPGEDPRTDASGDQPEEAEEHIEEVASLCGVGVDGSDQVLLAHDAFWAPAWSPDGAKIAFAGASGIEVVNADGSGRARVATDGWIPAWSPDGTMIAFVTSPSDEDAELRVVSADGSGPARVARIGGADLYFFRPPAWSPDGTKIAFVSGAHACDADVWVVNADGSGLAQVTDLPGAAQPPTWSPDGTQVAFATGVCAEDEEELEEQMSEFGGVFGTVESGGIYVVGPDGSGLTEVVGWRQPDEEGDGASRADAAIGEPSAPAWSPDGTKLLFDSERGLYTVGADGSDLTIVVHDAFSASATEPSVVGPWLPAWSPDGEQIAFSAVPCADIDSDCYDDDADIYLVDADGSGLAAVGATALDDLFPAWSPDGSTIAFVSGAPWGS